MAKKKNKKSGSSRSFSDSSGRSFSTHSAAAASNSSMGTNPRSSNYRGGNNPVVSSQGVRADVERTGADIRDLRNTYNNDYRMLQEQQQRLAERRSLAINDIKTEYDMAKEGQETGQASEFASRSTSLITSGGGFLGGTQSQQGVLQNLSNTHESEKTALFAKREAAINAANQAYEDKDFALAKEMSQSAKELQKEIYNRQKDYADQTLALSREKRSQTEFDLTMSEKKVQAYAMMDDNEFARQSPQDIANNDRSYYPGYTRNARILAKKAMDIKTRKDAISLDSDILEMRLKMPSGQRFSLGGVTYTGLKDSDSNSDLGKPSYSGESLPMDEATMQEFEAVGIDTGDVIKIQDLLNQGYSLKDIAKASNMSNQIYTTFLNYIQKP